MRVPARIFGTKAMVDAIEEGVYKQVSNVAMLPGIEKASMAMPDAHYGYGFPIGGVAAFNLEEGVISPGGVGYDINCGVRLITTDLPAEKVKEKLEVLMDSLFNAVPSGLGSKSQRVRVQEKELQEVCELGAKWAVENGYGLKNDLEHTEENGAMKTADFSKVSKRAKDRGKPQIGTLGSGNHFLEVQEISEIYDDKVADKFDLVKGNATIMVHCGSRGLGYQVADDYTRVMLEASKKYKIELPDKQLACAPIKSREAEDYIGAMGCAVNYAFANRQMIMHWVRETFEKIFPGSELNLLYDVAHNIAKFEEHDGKELCVHRKGATRAFAAGRKEIPQVYRSVGQPVIIPGSMGTASYVLVGTEKAMQETFGSTCHGAGRRMSRSDAIRKFRGADIQRSMEKEGKVVRAASPNVLAEEASEAYKDIDEVIKSVELAGISKKIVRLVPMGVAKG